MNEKCPVCSTNLNSFDNEPMGVDAKKFDCPRCGKYKLAGSLISTLPDTLSKDNDASAKISHVLRISYERKDILSLDDYNVKSLLKQPLPRLSQQADMLIRWLAEKIPAPGELVLLYFWNDGSIIGSKTKKGLQMVVDHISNLGFITNQEGDSNPEFKSTTLTFLGWEYYEKLRQGAVVYYRAFMAMQFGDSALNKMLDMVFRPSAKQAGFDLFKLDDVPRAGLIDDRLRVEIQSSDFIIADLTHDNLGAYWEAGYAEGLGKPVIYTCEQSKFEETKTHFDTNHHLTIIWNDKTPDRAFQELKATIRATLPHLAKLSDD
jgi:hypothetical protein